MAPNLTNMANEKNIIPNSERTPEERQEIARRGGKASGKSRRRKKTMREWAQIFGETPVKVKLPDGKEADATVLGQIVAAQMAKASRGDTKAAKWVSDLLEETQAAAEGVTIVVKSAGEAKKIQDIADLGV